MSSAEVPRRIPLTTTRTRPTFSRTSIRPSGVQVNAVGLSRPDTTGVAENPAVENTGPVTTWLVLDALDAKRASERYAALTRCDPAARADVLNEAVPPPSKGTCARMFGPSWKITIPVGVPVAGGTE